MDYERFKEGFQDALKAELAVSFLFFPMTQKDTKKIAKVNATALHLFCK